ncbi:putative spermidine/putrescine transport system ATP-binding protein [Rhizobiales bacterium GAS188]|nr:putative spermidine/putrescine transport system ATP-binding protein [Rhizobiales bacterium GAS188]
MTAMTIESSTEKAAARKAPSGASVVLDHLDKRFGSVVAVDDLCLTIDPGEFITFLGPSGSGKTTTLMLIAGFEFPTAGEIFIDGAPIVRMPPYRRNIGMVFQNYALFPHMTVAENVGFPLKQRGVDRETIAKRVAEVLETVQLAGYQARFPRQLSGGQQQRIALARAIIFNPRVLLMDEPLSALDKQLREGLQLEIKRLHERLGITFIYVTHDQREALVMSDRIAVMNNGRIEQLGSPGDLYDRPANRFVASFVGESNFLEGRVEGVEQNKLVVSLGAAKVRAIGHAGFDAGAPVVLTVRPEKLLFAESGAASRTTAVNVLPAIVREVTFVGEMHRYVVETEFGAAITLKQQHRFGIKTPALLEAVTIEWSVEDTLVVGAEEISHARKFSQRAEIADEDHGG